MKITKPKPCPGTGGTNRGFLPFLTVIAVFMMLGMSGTLQAQTEESGEKDVEELDPFILVDEDAEGYFSTATTAGTRFAQKLTDIPQTVTVVNRELMDDTMAWKPERALNVGTAGVVSNASIRTDLQIRGFRQQQQFRDGVESPIFSTLPMYDIERMEVVKGPSAMTFGDSSVVGGTVNFVSRKPTMEPKADIKFTVSGNEFYRLSANVSGPFDRLMPEGALKEYAENTNLRYRFTLGHQHDDRVFPLESDDQQFYGGAVSGDFGNTTVNLETYYYQLNGYTYLNDFVDTSAPSPGPIVKHPLSDKDFQPSSLEAPNDLDVMQFYFKAETVTTLNERQSLRLFYRYRQHDEDRRHLRGITFDSETFILNRQDIPLIFDNDENVIQADYLHEIRHPWIGGNEMIHNFTGGVQWVKKDLGTRLDVIALDPIDVRNPDFSNDLNRPTPTFAASNTDVNATQTSWYLQSSTQFWGDKLLGIGGVRWIRGEDFLEDFNKPEGEQISFNNAPTKQVARAGGIFKPIEGISIYGVHSSTFTIQTGVDPDTGEVLEDQDGLMDEIGIKFSGFEAPFGGTIWGSLAYFDMALTNVRIVTTTDEGEPKIIQNDNTVEGGEFELGYSREVGPGNIQTILTGFFASAVDAGTGGQALESPEEVYSAFVSYKVNEGPLDGLSFGGSWRHEGSRPSRISAGTGFFHESVNLYDAFIRYTYNENWYGALNFVNIGDNQTIIRAAATGLAMSRTPREIEFTLGYQY